MPRPLKDMPQAFFDGFVAIDKELAESFAVESLTTAVDASVGPEKSPTSTGRYRASLRTGIRRKRFDAGMHIVYPEPGKREAKLGIERRKFGQSVTISTGVPYAKSVELRYHPLERGFNAGMESLDLNRAQKAFRKEIEG